MDKKEELELLLTGKRMDWGDKYSWFIDSLNPLVSFTRWWRGYFINPERFCPIIGIDIIDEFIQNELLSLAGNMLVRAGDTMDVYMSSFNAVHPVAIDYAKFIPDVTSDEDLIAVEIYDEGIDDFVVYLKSSNIWIKPIRLLTGSIPFIPSLTILNKNRYVIILGLGIPRKSKYEIPFTMSRTDIDNKNINKSNLPIELGERYESCVLNELIREQLEKS